MAVLPVKQYFKQNKRLENIVALVTGGNGGIGYATAKEFLEQGAKVIITARDKTKLEQAIKSLGNGAHGILSDAILYLNAGYYNIIPFELNTEEYYDSMKPGL